MSRVLKMIEKMFYIKQFISIIHVQFGPENQCIIIDGITNILLLYAMNIPIGMVKFIQAILSYVNIWNSYLIIFL